MIEDVICPSCGFRNPPDAESCAACNFPLARDRREGAIEPTRTEESSAGIPTYAPRRSLRRPPRGPAPLTGQAMWLWLLFGTFAAVVLIATAVQTFRKSNAPEEPPVAGATPDQQQLVNTALAAIKRDSTNVEAQVSMANVLYDTGNWDQAIVHYRAALRRDTTRVPVMVDLGVCYYNLGETPTAVELFRRALTHDPAQPVALFNLGIVAEKREDFPEALEWYRRALPHASPEMRPTVAAAEQRVSRLMGRAAPPGAAPGK